MAVSAGTVFLDVRPNVSGFNAELNARMRANTSSLGQAGAQAGSSMASGLIKGFVALKAFDVVKNFTSQSISAASDLNESMSKVSVVFGKSATSIVNWSKTSATAMGISQQSALEAAGTFGNLFRAMDIGLPTAATMSKNLVQLASDLASFNNANPEDVLIALRSGLVGEVEPMRKFGVSLSAVRIQQEAVNMGLAKSGEELDAATKAQVAYAIILNDTKLAQGDFVRTSSGLANSQRILSASVTDLQASFGKALMPVIAQVTKIASQLLGWFTKLPEPIRNITAALTLMTVAVGAGALAWQALNAATSGLPSAWAGKLLGAIKSVTAALWAQAAAIPVVGAAMKALTGFFGTGAAGMAKFGVTAAAVTVGILDIKNALQTTEGSVDAMGKRLGLSDAQLDKIRESTTSFASELGSFVTGGGPMDNYNEKMSLLNDSVNTYVQNGGSFVTIQKSIADHSQEITDILAKYPPGSQEAADALAEVFSKERTDRIKEATDAVRDHGLAFDQLSVISGTAADDLRSAWKQALNGTDADLVKFAESATQSLQEWEQTTSDSFSGVDDLLGELADKHNLTAQKIIDSFHAQEKAITDYNKNWTTLQKEVGPKADELLQHVADMGLDGSKFLEVFANASKKRQHEIVESFGGIQGKSDDLTGVLEKSLVPAIEELITSIREAAGLKPVNFKFDADTSDVRDKAATLVADLKDMGFTSETLIGRKKFHEGGHLPGRGEYGITVEGGEYIIRKDVVKKKGMVDLLEAINEGKLGPDSPAQKFHQGGPVQPIIPLKSGPTMITELETQQPLTLDALLQGLVGVWRTGYVPAAWGGFSNGNIPLSAMTPIDSYPHYLAPEAASAFFAMQAAYGNLIRPITSAYRTLGQQAGLQGNPGPVAPVGQSMHGWGKALDLGAANAVGWMRAGNSKRFNWWPGDSFNDPYHFSYGFSAKKGWHGTLPGDTLIQAHSGERVDITPQGKTPLYVRLDRRHVLDELDHDALYRGW